VEEASGIVSQARQLAFQDRTHHRRQRLQLPGPDQKRRRGLRRRHRGAAWKISSTSPLNVKFVDDYTKKYNRPPDQFAAQAFAGVHIAYQAAKAAGTADNR